MYEQEVYSETNLNNISLRENLHQNPQLKILPSIRQADLKYLHLLRSYCIKKMGKRCFVSYCMVTLFSGSQILLAVEVKTFETTDKMSIQN